MEAKSNWFADNLPSDVAPRHDGKFNVWNLTTVHDGKETDLKWQVIAVFNTREEAEEFRQQKKK